MTPRSGSLLTTRLRLRMPEPGDAAAIFETYASDPETTRYLGWPRHQKIEDTEAFLSFCRSAWKRWPLGPLLIEDRTSGQLLGSTGLEFETPYRASVGFLLTAEARGKGYALEALQAVVDAAPGFGVRRLYALCHVDNSASRRLLKRAQFELEGVLRNYLVFPNLDKPGPQDTCCYARVWGGL